MNSNTIFDYMSHNLAVKAAAMNSYTQRQAWMNGIASLAYASNTPENMRIKLREEIENSNFEARRKLRAEAKLSIIPVKNQIAVLRDMALVEKRKLLDAMPIIPVPVGAAFLGVPEADLHIINSQRSGVFGDIYLRRRCNSMNELKLIAQNPGWLPNCFDPSSALVLSDPSVLDSSTYVDIRTAAAYTNMKLHEVDNQVKSNGRFSYLYGPTYRLADLEKIRVAKLKAKQA